MSPINVKRIAPKDAQALVASEKALLVCAYDSASKFEQARLDRVISLDDFKSRLANMVQDQQIIFY